MDTAPRPQRRRRWPFVVLTLFLLLVALPLVGFVSWHKHLRSVYHEQLQAAVARTDELDPDWRLEQIEARRAIVREDENSALRVLAARKLLPANWPPSDFDDDWKDVPAPKQLRRDRADALRDELGKVRPAVEEARRLKDFHRGRYPISYRPNFLHTVVPHVQPVREVCYLLWADALLRAQENDIDGALDSCRAILNSSRSLGDEPLLTSVLVRMACDAMAVRCLGRVLAQGEPSEPALFAAWRLLEDEAKENLLLQGLRGNRAGLHGLSLNIESERLVLESISEKERPPEGWENVSNLWVIPRVMRGHVEALDKMNEAVEAAKQPPEEHVKFFEELTSSSDLETPYARLLMPACGKIGEAYDRVQAELRCAIVAVAAERYRRKYGRWPQTLQKLAPEFLHTLPTDPFDGQPLRYLRQPDGVVIYAIGQDRHDDGGRLYRSGEAPGRGNDIGFRLWDLDKRRQPPPPPKAAAKAPDR